MNHDESADAVREGDPPIWPNLRIAKDSSQAKKPKRLWFLAAAVLAVIGITFGIWFYWWHSRNAIDPEVLDKVSRVKPGMTLDEAEGILGKAGWDESARAMGFGHRWPVGIALAEHGQKARKDPRAHTSALWVSKTFVIQVVVDEQDRVLACDLIPLKR